MHATSGPFDSVQLLPFHVLVCEWNITYRKAVVYYSASLIVALGYIVSVDI